MVPRAKTCRFKVGGETKSIALQYRRGSDETIRNAAKSAAATLEPLPPVRRIGSAVWVSIPSFVGVDEATGARLRQIVDDAPNWRDAAVVVFDVRGNSGGNSAWGNDILKGLYGEEFVRAAITPSFDRQYVEWRVSKDNLAHVRAIVEDVKRQQGAESESAKYFQRVAEGMEGALAQGQAMFRLIDDDEDDDEERWAEARPTFGGKVVLLTDRRCGSACLDFADRVRLLPNVRHVGVATFADSVYMEVRPVDLPSGAGRLGLPVKVYRDRPRGHNEPYEPHVPYEGDINDTPAVEKWVLSL